MHDLLRAKNSFAKLHKYRIQASSPADSLALPSRPPTTQSNQGQVWLSQNPYKTAFRPLKNYSELKWNQSCCHNYRDSDGANLLIALMLSSMPAVGITAKSAWRWRCHLQPVDWVRFRRWSQLFGWRAMLVPKLPKLQLMNGQHHKQAYGSTLVRCRQ